MLQENWASEELVKILKGGGVAVIPTDTMYGIVGGALSPESVERIYEIRKRAPTKPCIILIKDISELEKFSIHLSEKQLIETKKYWSGPVSIIFDCLDERLSYLHRGTNSLAFRVPALPELKDLLSMVGPLIAPSANTEGNPPSKDTKEAREYFGDKVHMYVDIGPLISKPSKVIRIREDGLVTIIRE